MTQQTCPCCGKILDQIPLDIAFKRPEPFVRIPEEDRATRCQADDDYCVIDKSMYFIRGYLPVPINGTDRSFGWGFWCKVHKDDYMVYCRASVPGAAQPKAFEGFLANTARTYEGIEGLRLMVEPLAPDKRPTLRLEPCDHLLHREQRDGVSMKRVHQINTTMFPDKYG